MLDSNEIDVIQKAYKRRKIRENTFGMLLSTLAHVGIILALIYFIVPKTIAYRAVSVTYQNFHLKRIIIFLTFTILRRVVNFSNCHQRQNINFSKFRPLRNMKFFCCSAKPISKTSIKLRAYFSVKKSLAAQYR